MYKLSEFSRMPATRQIAERDLQDQLRLCRKVGEKGFLVIKSQEGLYPVYHYATEPKQSPKIIKVVKI